MSNGSCSVKIKKIRLSLHKSDGGNPMKRFFGQLSRFYSLKAGGWLGAALLCLAVLPFLVRSFFMLAAGHSISVWIVLLAEAVGWIGAWLFFVFAVRSLVGHPGGGAVGETVKVFYRGGIWLAAVATMSGTFYSLLLAYGSLIAIRGAGFLYLVLMAIAGLVVGFALSTTAFWLLCIQASPEHDIPFGQVFRYWIKRPVLVLSSSAAAAVFLFLLPILHDGIVRLWPGLQVSFLSQIAASVLSVAAQWALFVPLVCFLFQHALRQRGPLPQETQSVPSAASAVKVPFLRRHLSFAVALALLVLAGLYNTVLSYPVSPVKAIRQDIETLLTYQELMADAGDPAAAAYYNNLATGRLLAWRGAVLAKPEDTDRALSLSPSDEQVQLLSALTRGNALSTLESGYMGRVRTPAWQVALLDAYAELENPTEQQQVRYRELLRSCILHGYHLQTAILPDQLARRQDDLTDDLARLEEQLVPGKRYALVARMGSDGGVTPELVGDSLTLAEAYPDEIHFQYLAMANGASYLIDGASHYTRTAEAAIRYDALYMEQVDKKTPEEEIVRMKQTVARALVSCGELRKCVDLLEENTYADATLDTLQASCLFSLKEYGQCLATTATLLDKDPDNPQTLYLAAICALQTGQRTDSIRYGSRLAALVETAEDPLETECLLYPYLLRCTIADATGGYTTELYSTLTEEESSLLMENPFLYNYMTAAHLWSRNNEEARTQALDLLDGILGNHPDLSRALYMKGAILHERQEDDEAAAALLASISIDDEQPTAWYALATLYDRAGEYEAAYAACQKVIQYLPASDHAYDVFGVSIHTQFLMDKLEPLVKGGG